MDVLAQTQTGWRYLPPEMRRALGGLQFRPRIRAHGRVSGLHLSSHQGQSLEFSDLKGYAFGDDPRGIDWKVFARTDKLYVRRYLDETNLTAHLLIDASGSMAYPDRPSKFEHAARMMAGLAYVLLRQGDEVGLLVAHERRPAVCPPRGVASHLGELMSVLERAHPSHKTVIQDAVVGVADRSLKNGVVIVASDLLAPWEAMLDLLGGLVARGFVVIVLHVLSPEERTFPFQGAVVFGNLETGRTDLVDARGLKQHYMTALNRFLDAVKASCHDAGVFYHPVDMRESAQVSVATLLKAIETGH